MENNNHTHVHIQIHNFNLQGIDNRFFDMNFIQMTIKILNVKNIQSNKQ